MVLSVAYAVLMGSVSVPIGRLVPREGAGKVMGMGEGGERTKGSGAGSG